MEQNIVCRQQLIQEYKQIISPFLRYLPWLEQSAGTSVSTSYQGNNVTEHSLAFPVYDGTLMNFVRELTKSPLMDRNYQYVYSRNKIRNHDDERRMIKKAGIDEWKILCGILSKYVLGGRTKGYLWNEAVQEKIFYYIMKQMREIIEYWDRPIDVR